MTLTNQNNFRFHELDTTRFLAALAVLLYHYTFSAARLLGTPAFGIDKISRYGYLGVDAFFIISGYVVLMSSMHKSPKYFLISRVVRLYPAYFICCIITFVVLYFGKVSTPEIPHVTLKLLIYNLTMFQEFLGKVNLSGIFWTLTYELGFYFIILMLAALKLWKHLILIIILWLTYTLFINYSTEKNAFSFFLIPKYSPCFIAGMLFYLLRINYTKNWKIYLLIIFCFLVNIKNNIQITEDMNNFYHDANAMNTIVVFSITLLFYTFFFLSASEKLNFKVFRHTSRLGVLTYPLYLMHPFGIGIFMALGATWNKYFLLLLATTLSISISFLIYKFVEERFRNRFKSLMVSILR
jgi:peptidoglycan/LPS O-acetylase OafA/YrhL